MSGTSALEDKAQQLAAAGYDEALVEYLGSREAAEIENSPGLALLYGTAHARLGRHVEGLRWLDIALQGARQRDERAVERRALNARGAMALVSGRLGESAEYFTQGLMVAGRDGDVEMTGRCSNNLAIVSHLLGRHAEAIGSWQIALAAFQRAGRRKGVGECRNNLCISYREQGEVDRSLAEADQAVAEARAAGDGSLWAMALRVRAETRVRRGDLALAREGLDQVSEIRGRIPNRLERAEDLRVEAAWLAASGQLEAAERALRAVIDGLEAHLRPQLLAEATRDLAVLLSREGRTAEAQVAARAAQALFTDMGAEGEIRRLASHQWSDDFAAELRGPLERLHRAQVLADSGRNAELVAFLGTRPDAELEASPLLALLNGIGHSRLGRLNVGRRWATVALSRAQALGDRVLGLRAFNVCGAIALELGGLDEAMRFFGRAQEQATQTSDMVAVGQCANNLGIIASIQGDHSRAVGAFMRAIAAYQRGDCDRGVAESRHHLGIAYREQGLLDEALKAADQAVQEAERLGDRQLKAQALAGRAEIHVARGEADVAVREAESALAAHRELRDPVRETEDLRILAVALDCDGRREDAEQMLLAVIVRATEHGRRLLVATAERDLAHLLARAGEPGAAAAMAQRARAGFARLGAVGEMAKLDPLLKNVD